ncbi:MAG: aldo/keto reductase, partial [Candidatus Limnocylindrales bacterium]
MPSDLLLLSAAAPGAAARTASVGGTARTVNARPGDMMWAMEERRLGRSGLSVSALGLGTNNFGTRLDEAGAREVLDAALDIGVTFIDTADSYGQGRSEELLGRLLGAHRNEVVIATKFGSPMGDLPYR